MLKSRLAIHLPSFGVGFGFNILFLICPLYLFFLGKDRLLLINLLIFTIPSLLSFFCCNFWGALVDLTQKVKRYLVIALFLTGLLFLILILTRQVAISLLLLFLITIFSYQILPLLETYITLPAQKNQFGKPLAGIFASNSFGWLVSGVLASFLFQEAGHSLKELFWISGLLLLGCGLWASFFLKEISARPEALTGFPARKSLFVNLFQDLRVIYGDKRLFSLCILLFFIKTGNWTFITIYSVYMVDFLKGPRYLIGLSTAFSTLLGLITFIYLGPLIDKYGERRILLVTAWGYLIYALGVIMFPNPYIIALLYMLPIYPGLYVAGGSLMANLTLKSNRGGGMGIFEGITCLATAVGGLISGLSQYYPVTYVPYIAFIFMLLGLLGAYSLKFERS